MTKRHHGIEAGGARGAIAVLIASAALGLGLVAGACVGSSSPSSSSSNGGMSSASGGRTGGSGGDAATMSDRTGGRGGDAATMNDRTGGSGGDAATNGGSGAAGASWDKRTRARLLLSGHSLTDNPIGPYVEQIAEAHGRDYGWETQLVIGSPIRIRTRGDNADSARFEGYSRGANRNGSDKDLLSELAAPTSIGASERYDTLVIAERHDILDSMKWERTVPLLRHYHDRLREHESKARTFLYQTWPDINKSEPLRWIDYADKELIAWECAAAKVNLSLKAESLPQSIRVVPAAVVLARFVKRALDGDVPGISGGQEQRLNALFEDAVHPTKLGKYLMAATIYAAVFGESAKGAPIPSDVDAAAGAIAADVAWQVVSEYYGGGETPWIRTMDECRTAVSAMCGEYYAIRQRDPACQYWSDPAGPLEWPDTTFPYPAPQR